MKTIILFLTLSFLMIADSVKVDVSVTFYDLTLEQATELEKLINKEFKGYSFDISIPEKEKKFNIWDYSVDDNTTLPYLKWDEVTGEWIR